MIETNFLSVVALTTEVVKGMRARNKGHIVNMSSIAGKEAYQGGGLYCASKFALVRRSANTCNLLQPCLLLETHGAVGVGWKCSYGVVKVIPWYGR